MSLHIFEHDVAAGRAATRNVLQRLLNLLRQANRLTNENLSRLAAFVRTRFTTNAAPLLMGGGELSPAPGTEVTVARAFLTAGESIGTTIARAIELGVGGPNTQTVRLYVNGALVAFQTSITGEPTRGSISIAITESVPPTEVRVALVSTLNGVPMNGWVRLSHLHVP